MDGRRLLIVEDHAQLRQVLALTLRAEGFVVSVAISGDDAMQQLIGGLEVDVVLTDIRMPGTLNGLDLARWIRSTRPLIRVVVQTGFTQEDTGGFVVLAKPFTDQQLLAVLRGS
jgi:CheY-like chemotaxis protein